jgi:hypothetical protein
VSYEFNAANGRFEISNPYRLENVVLLFCGGVATITALYMLLGARTGIASAEANALRAVVVGVVLLFVGLGFIGKALTQLRYYFGRGRPHDLSNPDDPATRDSRGRAAWLKESLRQNSLVYSEPRGPISGLLHHLIGNLIFAPREVRFMAEVQFFNALFTVALLLCILVGWMLYPEGSATDWIAVFVAAALARPLIRRISGAQGAVVARAPANKLTVVLMALIPILGPPLLAKIATFLPDISAYHIARTVMICLLILLVTQGLFFAALLQQLLPQPAINMSCEQRTLSLNGNPAKLFEELERLLQTRWTETIPNRAYSAVRPPDVVSGQSGSFAAELLQETQPTPDGALDQGGPISEALTQSRTRSVAALLLLGALTFVAGTIAAATARLSVAEHAQIAHFVSSSILAVVLLVAALYALRSAHLLLGRVDFSSTLLWIEFAGTYEEAEINVGNQLTTALSSTKKVINVETMTLRVWVAELTSVILQKDGSRDLIGMRGRPDLAAYYADHLTNFARQMSSVVAPVSQADQARIAALGRAQQESGLMSPAGVALPGMSSNPAVAGPAQSSAGQAVTAAKRFCESCGSQLSPAAAFCSTCGTKVQ